MEVEGAGFDLVDEVGEVRVGGDYGLGFPVDVVADGFRRAHVCVVRCVVGPRDPTVLKLPCARLWHRPARDARAFHSFCRQTLGTHSRGRVSQLMTAEISRTTASAPGLVGLVDDEEVCYLHKAGLHGLHGVAAFGDYGDDYGVGEAHDVELRLAYAHSLDNGHIRAVDVQELHGVSGAPGEAALTTAGGHAADVDARVLVVTLHADAGRRGWRRR